VGKKEIMDAELERFKTGIDLTEFACSYGYVIDERESCRTCNVMRHSDGSKIVVATGTDGHGIYFDVHDATSSGSVIDFVIHRKGVNLGFARKELREWLGTPNLSFPIARKVFTRPRPITRDRAGLFAAWQGMEPYSGTYLQGRGLSPETIAAFADHIRISVTKDGKYRNVVFRHDDEDGLSGWEVKNRGLTGFAGGGEKALFLCQAGKAEDTSRQRIIIAESAIDAMSCYQLHPTDGIYISFAGGLNPTQPELLRRTLARYPRARIFIATDNDLPTEKHPNREGEEYYARIRELCPPTATVIRACPPEPFKDWNDKINNRPRQPKKDDRSHVERHADAPGAGQSSSSRLAR